MGLTPFSCVTARDCVRIVYPDGHVENRSRRCSVKDLLLGNTDYYVCGSTPYSITNRMAGNEMLECGFTYFVSATPNAQPFLERKSKKVHRRAKIFPRLSRHGAQGQDSRSSVLGNPQSRKVFDYDSATMQRLESMRGEGEEQKVVEDGTPKHLKLVFIRHCLQQLRLHRNSSGVVKSHGNLPEEVSPPPSVMDDKVMQMILKSSARSELGIYVSRRQEFYLRRARRRRKIAWKPVLQSISEMKPVVEFHAPEQQQECEFPPKNTPPALSAPPKNISPPRRQVSGMPRSTPPTNNVSPPRSHFFVPPVAPAALKYSSASQQARRTRSNGRSLYMA